MFKNLGTILVLCFAAVLLTGTACAAITQTADEQINLGTNTLFYSVVPADGGYFIAAVIDDKLAVLKTDANFKVQSQTEIKGTKTAGLVTTDDGGCVVLAVSGTKDATLYRMDAKCGIVWETPIYDTSFGIKGVAVSGSVVKTAGWLAGTDTGIIQGYSFANGNPANDEMKLENKPVMAIQGDGDTWVMVGGTHSTPRTKGSSAWIMKMQEGGKIVFETTIRDNCDEENASMYQGGYGAAAYNFCKTSDGGYYVVGTQTPFSSDNLEMYGQIWGAKINKSGKVTWQKDLKGAIPYGVAEIDGQYVIAGYALSTAYCYFVTADGLVYRENYEDESVGCYYSVESDNKGNVILGGCINRGDGKGACGYVTIFNDSGKQAASPVPVFGIAAGLLGAAALFLRRK
ncbi:MAG TPA: hypothetical protein O0X39_05750 [Methanocorpusculum sp.]|nr:hypothetical protein [Methanocorpusculum sp.]